jgi:sugar lactone lactonase YvrE
LEVVTMRGQGFRSLWRRPLLVATVSILALCWGPGAGPDAKSAPRHRYDVQVFARIPNPPGLPEGIAVDRRPHHRRHVIVGTNHPPSAVLVYGRRGTLLRRFKIRGQDASIPTNGLYGLALDRKHRIYAADFAPARIVRLNPRNGAQRTYARFPDVPSCSAVARQRQCSQTVLDRPPFPNFPVFTPDGAMYVTDNAQALIWRVPPDGGKARVWLTDPGMESTFGPNGMALMPGRHRLMFAETNQGLFDFPAGLYTVRIKRTGRPGTPRLFWQTSSFDAPDGFAIARSRRIYVALSAPGGNPGLVVLSPRAKEIARVPPSPAQNEQQEVPFDAPANVAFLGRRALVTNHAFTSMDSEHYAVLDVYAGERGLRPVRP